MSFVVLFSTHYRTWDTVAVNHMKVIHRLGGTPCVVGIHVWDGDDVPDQPPAPIRALPHVRMTKTRQKPQRNIFEYILVSTRIALDNAESVYRERYGTVMPDDTIIVRMRPDTWVDSIATTIHPNRLCNLKGKYVSIWNTNHRPFTANAPEVADTIYFTTKRVLRALVDTPFHEYDAYFDRKRNEGFDIDFHEQLLHHAIEMCGATVVNDHSLRLGLYRASGYVEKLTYT